MPLPPLSRIKARGRRALDSWRMTMYVYIVQRTQIYLTKRESEALDRASRATGRTRSQLIREAVEATYLAAMDERDLLAALGSTAGMWADRPESGEDTVERLRRGRLARVHGEA